MGMFACRCKREDLGDTDMSYTLRPALFNR